jgi:hypothetical protein
MGDRVLFQVWAGTGKEREVSPVVYGHWAGDEAPAICARLQERMKGREGDVQYTAARLVQEVCGTDKGNMSVGIWNRKTLLRKQDSHGDAGVVLVEAAKDGIRFQCVGGYLLVGDDGMPKDPNQKT